MQFQFRKKHLPARRAPGRRTARRSSRALARRLRIEPLECRALLIVTPLVTATTQARVFVPDSQATFDDIGTDWITDSYDDAAWQTTPALGPNGAGFNTLDATYAPYIGANVQLAMQGVSRTAFMRIPFTATNVASFDTLTLNMRFDDGFIVYLNGTEIQRVNATAATYPAWNAGPTTPMAAVATPATYDVSGSLNLLREGQNVLAVRGFNSVLIGPNTFLMQAALDAAAPDVPPTANDDAITFRTDQAPPAIDVVANDVPGSAPIARNTVQVVSPPTSGTTTVNPISGAITYTPAAGFSGTDTFTYRVRDNTPAPPAQTVVARSTAPHRTLVPTLNDASLGLTWTGGNEPFNDSAWTAGVGGIGYDRDTVNTDFTPYINDNIELRTYNVNSVVYERIPFTVDPSRLSGLQLRLRYDDGFIAYINGVEVAQMHAPAAPTWNSVAPTQNGDVAAILQQTFTINLANVTLREGEGANILAIATYNQAPNSSDFLMESELVATFFAGVPSNEATVTVTVQGPGPAAADDFAPTSQVNQLVTVPVLDNDVPGFSGAAIRRDTVMVTQPPANGTIEAIDLATGAITYRPNPGFFGDDVFSYTVRDAAMVGGSASVELIPAGAVWKYLDDGSDQGTAWTGASFNDASWASGPAELGYGDGDEVTVVSFGGNAAAKYITTYFRRTFDLTDASAVQTLNVMINYDDGAVVYINGTEVARVGMPAGTVNYTTTATAQIEDQGTPQSVAMLTGAQLAPLRDGTNVVAVEIHQGAANSSDISFDFRLVADVDTPTGYESNEADVHIHVNAPPIVGNDTISVGPFGTLGTLPSSITFNPLANDNDPDNSPSTPPGSSGINPTTVTITQQPPPLTGTVAVNPNTGQITFTNTSLKNPRTFTFGYTVTDYEGATSQQATVTVNVVVVPPQPGNDTAVTPEGQPVVISVLPNDNRGDLPINTSSVTIDVNALPSNGTVEVNATAGTIRYTPNAGFRDQFDSFGYTITDLSGNRSNTATVTVDVFSLAIARDDGFALAQGNNSVTIPIADILANDYFPGSFQPEVVLVTNSQSGGTAVINSSGGVQQSVTFTKAAGATGVAGFTYYLRDSQPNPTRPNSNNARVSIALGAVNVSGKVYVDVNRNNVYDAGEQLVPDATIVLTRAGDSSFRRTTMTNSLGQYSFVSTAAGVLPPDVYTITEIQPALYLDFTTGAVNSYTVELTAEDNPGYDFREWTINPQFFTMLANYGGGFLASQQPVSLSANSLVVPYDLGWNGAFTARATYDPALGNVSVKLYNGGGSLVASSTTNPASTPGNSVVTYQASPSQPLVLVVSGTNPNVLVDSPSLGTTAGDTTPPYVAAVSLSSTSWSSEFAANLAAHSMGAAGYSVAPGETLPWRNLDRVSIRFTEPVAVAREDLRLWGVAVADYRTDVGVQSFAYDPVSFTATWTLAAPIAADQLRVSLSDAVRDTWGNRVGGSLGFERFVNVLPGSAPLADVLARQFSSIGTPRYAPQFDFDGNGVVNFVDAIHARNAAGTSLPAGTPGSGSTSTPSPQAPAAVVVAAPRDAGLDVSAASRRAASAPATASASRRLSARSTRAAATDAALDAALDNSSAADSGSTAAASSLSALRARRAARSAEHALSSLGGSM